MVGLLVLLGIVLTALWIILPFAVFGIKGRLDRIIALLEDDATRSGKR